MEVEPIVTINGTALTVGQAMTVRVAIENMAMNLKDGLGEDEHGRFMTRAYRENIVIIRRLMYGISPVVHRQLDPDQSVPPDLDILRPGAEVDVRRWGAVPDAETKKPG
jgi:hypothetical protein